MFRLMKSVRTRLCLQTTLVMLLLLGSTGCASIGLATLGTALGALGSAASTGSSVYKLGKLDSAEMASYADTRWAVRQAATDLDLHVSVDAPDEKDRTIWHFAFCDLKKAETDVTVERRASMVCLVRVNVGILGSEPTARLIMRRIHAHLPGGLAEHPD